MGIAKMADYKPVIIYRAKDKCEKQYVRDILLANDIHILHVPSLTAALYGVMHSLRIAVNETDADRAIKVLKQYNINALKELALAKGRDIEDAASPIWRDKKGKRLAILLLYAIPFIVTLIIRLIDALRK